MCNELIKQIQAEKRRLTIGQISDSLISGDLRRELLMSKEEFSSLIVVCRISLRRVEGFEITPNMRMILNTASALKFGIDFPECGKIEISRRRVKAKNA
ncbi:TPA: helix-turn-helix domain-containing protein [Citrobacter braakii]|uniref:Uncharacterized protein n=1 Tax=Citrobacter braakii TaxID=57706 RepID=A0AAD1L230_CITBR|nr:hypothetical protein KAM621c_24380 [Citrobacter braakii]HEE0062724.1 XRE family transcriptional regulator [Citrobacter braakii]HEE9823233.1 XRE family transcriptional regulator [Citrobacter braakii]